MKSKPGFSRDLLFFGSILLILVLTAGGHIVQGDEETMFRVTQNLVKGKGLAVGREEIIFPEQEDPFLPSSDERIWTTSGVPGRDSLVYSKYGLGQSLAAIPLFLLGQGVETLFPELARNFPGNWITRLFVSMLNPLALAGCGWLMYRFGIALGYSPRTSRWVALAAIFSTYSWAYVKTFFSQPSVMFTLLGAVYTAFQWRKTNVRSWLWWFSAACSAAVIFRISALIIIPALVGYLLFSVPRALRWRWVVPLIVGLGLALGFTAAYNWMRFESIISSGYGEIAWTTPILYGLYGLLFSSGKGAFFYAPILILCLVAGIGFSRKNKWEAALIGSLCLTYLGFYAPHNYWTGGFNWGPRFLLPMIPLACIPLGSLLEQKSIRGNRLLFFGLFSLGICIQLPAIIVDHSRFLTQQFEGNDISETYTRIIEDISYSPVVNQWPTAIQVIKGFPNADIRERARSSFQELSTIDTDVPNGNALLVSDFIRLNTLDFWWYHIFVLRGL